MFSGYQRAAVAYLSTTERTISPGQLWSSNKIIGANRAAPLLLLILEICDKSAPCVSRGKGDVFQRVAGGSKLAEKPETTLCDD